MKMFSKKTPKEKEWQKLEKKENLLLARKTEKRDSRLNQMLQDKIPERLQGTLDAAFAKAFSVIFEKGTGVIEKTYNREEIQKSYQIDEYAAGVRRNHKFCAGTEYGDPDYRSGKRAFRRIIIYEIPTGDSDCRGSRRCLRCNLYEKYYGVCGAEIP